MCQELPALAVALPQGHVAAEVSQHSRVPSLIAPPPSPSDLDRKLGAAPNDADGEVTLEIPSGNGVIPRQDPTSPKGCAELGWGGQVA